MTLTAKQQTKLNEALAGRELTMEQQEQILDSLQLLIQTTGRQLDEGVQETPFRMLKALLERTKGYTEDPKVHLTKTFDVECRDTVLVKDIMFSSDCEHHWMSFFGRIHIAYIPGKKITGLSKFGRLVEGYAKRLQVQERLTQDIGKAIDEVLEPIGTMVVCTAEHTCMTLRGISKPGAETVTMYTSGVFNKPEKRQEVLNMISMGKCLS